MDLPSTSRDPNIPEVITIDPNPQSSPNVHILQHIIIKPGIATVSNIRENMQNLVPMFEKAHSKKDFSLLAHKPNQIIQLATQLGSTQTREKLLPFIKNSIGFVPQEPFMIVLTQLEHLVPHIIGEQQINTILNVFENIFESTSEVIKEKAVFVLNNIITSLVSSEVIENQVMPFIIKLTDIWKLSNPSLAIIGISLLFTVHSKASKISAGRLRVIFRKLLRNENPLVQLECAKSLLNWTKKLPTNVVKDFYSTIINLAHSNYEEIRKYSVDLMMHTGYKLVNESVFKQYLRTMLFLMDDKSIEIRKAVIKNVVNVIGYGDIAQILLLYEKGFKSTYPEISKFTADNLIKFGEKLCDFYGSPNIFGYLFRNGILKLIQGALNTSETDLGPELSQHEGIQNQGEIRLIVAKSLVSFCWTLDTELFKDHICPMITNISDKKIRHYWITESFQSVPASIQWHRAIHNINDVFENLISNTRECDWKVRRNLLIPILQVSQKCGSENFIQIAIVYIRLLCDPNLNVARTATLIFPLLVRYFGDKITRRVIFPMVRTVMRPRESPQKITSLLMINELIFPTLEFPLNCGQYLKIFQRYVYNPSYVNMFGRKVVKICMLNEKLQKKLYNQNINTGQSPNIETEEQRIYATDILDTLKRIYKSNKRIYDIKEDKDEACNKDYISYLETVLILAVQQCVDALTKTIYYSRNRLEIKTKAREILTNIRIFSDRIKEEEKQCWVIFIKSCEFIVNEKPLIKKEVEEALAYRPSEIDFAVHVESEGGKMKALSFIDVIQITNDHTEYLEKFIKLKNFVL